MENKKKINKEKEKNEDFIENDNSEGEEDINYDELTSNKIDKNVLELRKKKRLIVILEHANLEITKTKRDIELINSDDHYKVIRNMKKSLEEYRPDVAHQCLLSLFDSPLNKAGMLQVYIKTKNNVLIEINPKTRIPRTFKRFAGLMAQLLAKYRIRASDTSEILLKVIKNPVTDHLPMGSPVIATSEKSRLVDLDEYCTSLNKGKPVVFVVGAISQGDVDIDYSNDSISVSSYPLSAAVVCSKLCNSFEKIWEVL